MSVQAVIMIRCEPPLTVLSSKRWQLYCQYRNRLQYILTNKSVLFVACRTRLEKLKKRFNKHVTALLQGIILRTVHCHYLHEICGGVEVWFHLFFNMGSIPRRPLACWDYGFESRRGHGCLSLVSVLLSGTGLCDGLITRPEEPYQVWCV
jgi:hypothetical protein